MATGGTTTSVETLDVNEFDTNGELFAEALDLAAKKVDLVKEQKQLIDAGLSNNPEARLLEAEISQVDRSIDRVATEWADKHVWDLIKDPTKRAAAIAKKKEVFMNKLERKYKREERKEARLEKKAEKAGVTLSKEASDVKITLPQGASRVSIDVSGSETQPSIESNDGSAGFLEVPLIVKHLLDQIPPLSPSDLLQGARQEEAIDIVFKDRPALAASLKQKLTQSKDSPAYQDAIAELTKVKGTLDGTYSTLMKSDVALDQEMRNSLEGTALYKVKNLATEFIKKPEALVAGAVALFGLWMIKDKLPMDKIKTALGVTAVGGASIYALDFILEYATGKGLGDRLNIHPNKLVTGKVLEQYRSDLFAGMPENLQASTDDMVKLMDTNMSDVDDAFEIAQRTQKTEIDADRFLGRGTVSKSDINGKELKEGLDWCYLECADIAMKEPGGRKASDRADKLSIGLEWSKNNLKDYDFKAALVKIQREKLARKGTTADVATAGVASKEAPLSTESNNKQELLIRDPHLRELKNQDPAFNAVLKQLPGGEVSINGCPYTYFFTDGGAHRFASVLNPENPIVIPDADDRGGRSRLLAALTKESEEAVQNEFKKFNSDPNLTLRALPSGEWEVYPSLERMSHQGLAHSARETKVPFRFYTDGKGMIASYEGASDAVRFTSLAEVQKDFELKKALPDLVKQDVGHLLLGMDFTVENVVENEADKSTTLTLRYDSGHEGTLIYKNDTLQSSTLAESADLAQRWDLQAHKDTVALFSRSTIQDRIIHATGVNPDIYVRWNNITTNGLVPSEPRIEFEGGLFGTLGKTLDELVSSVVDSNDITGDTLAAREKAETEAKVKQGLDALATKMRTELTDLYKLGLTKKDFEERRKTLMANYEKDVIRIVGEKAEVSLAPVDLAKMKSDSGDQIKKALEPMSHPLSIGGDQSSNYADRLIYWQHKTVTEIESLASRVAATGRQPYKSEVEAIIRDNYAQASRDADAHRGLDTDQSGEILRTEKLTGAHKDEWKAPTEKVYSYVKERFNWKTAQVDKLMDIYYSKIENGGATPLSGATADQYADFFISSVYTLMGTKEKNLARVGQVILDDFDTKLPVLQSIKTFDEWSPHPETLPKPPELKDSKELYREHAKEEFTKWFDKNMDFSTWTGLEGHWPDVFRESVNKRFDRIVMDDSLSSEQLREKVKRFTQFVTVESALYKICIDGTYYHWYDIATFRKSWADPIEVRDRVIEKNFDATWKTSSDYKDYAAKLDKSFGDNVVGYDNGLLVKRLLALGVITALVI